MKKLRQKIIILLIILLTFINNYSFANNLLEVNLLWQNIVGGKSFERFNDIKETDDGGYIIVGHTNSYDYTNNFYGTYGDFDTLLIKYNATGKVEWTKSFGGEAFDTFSSVNVCRDGGFIVSGFTQSRYGNIGNINVKGEEGLIVKFDSRGNIEWEAIFGGSLFDRITNVIEVSDGYVAVGYSNSNDGNLSGLNKGEYDGVIVKLDRKGNIEWKKSFGGSRWDKFYSAIEVTGGYIIVGYSESNDKDLKDVKIKGQDGIIVKVSTNGDIVWAKSFGGDGDDEITSICKIDDGFIISGSTSSFNRDFDKLKYNGQLDAFISKLDFNANVKWTRTFGGSGQDVYKSLFYKKDFGIVAVGNTESNDGDLEYLNSGNKDALVVKYDLDGNLIWKKAFGKNGDDVFLSAVYSDFFGFIAVGYTTSKELNVNGNEDCLIVKFEEPRVKVSAVYFLEENKVIKKGETLKLNVNFVPVNATIKKIIWTSSNNNILTVDENGVIKARNVGEATITAKSVDGGYEAKCKIKVTQNYDKNKLPFIIWANKNIINKMHKNL
ncbi:MAG: Ig-like domain-containing protein [Caloramator sp.]|nr:Ig-like domain-containing protein [Caloramator sp.]